ncbi:hypothetical protein D7V97_06030 [Corallococcus sp. CA053C]|uniref:hypothetical protein n=1 Tax=Corallococcus sp. CA053C TaxID=2316732 RepID=UPI000EA0E56C|nr:hypothetical protein [Corallococcus sp. CA053C]RKH13330.1 hypothetical protein D7V97_06030 [Corallococcus sp. CA053C]
MNRSLRLVSVLSALAVGAGCESNPSTGSVGTPIVNTPEFQDTDLGTLTTRVSGFAWDPEAFFFSWITNGGPASPITPIISEINPLFLRSVTQNAQVTMLDPVLGKPAVPPVAAAANGFWVSPTVPSRASPPFFSLNAGGGSLPTTQPPGTPATLPPIPPVGRYLPTVTLRPIATAHSMCVLQESLAIGDNGILDAVARYLTATGTPTTALDFVDPTKFHGVNVFWLFQPGFPMLRAPAPGTTIEATSGQVFNVAWQPPGSTSIPPGLQSPRGFVVQAGSPTSGLGIIVVTQPASGPRAPGVRFTVVDNTTDAANRRPWKFDPINAPIVPGVITFAGLQIRPSTFEPPNPYGPVNGAHLCLP